MNVAKNYELMIELLDKKYVKLIHVRITTIHYVNESNDYHVLLPINVFSTLYIHKILLYIYFVKCLSNLINSWRFYKSNFNQNEFIFVYMLSIVFVEIFNDNKIFCNSRFIESFFKIYYGQFFYQRLCFLLSNYTLHTCTILSYFLFL